MPISHALPGFGMRGAHKDYLEPLVSYDKPQSTGALCGLSYIQRVHHHCWQHHP